MQSEQVNEIAAAMVKVQAAIGPAVKGKENPFFKTNYADLPAVWEACRDALQANGIAVIQGSQLVDGFPCMETKLLHTSGQWLSSLWQMTPAKPDPQAMGSAISYMRRYSLAAMVGILAEDDDGNAATRTPATMEKNRQKADDHAAKQVGEYLDKQTETPNWTEAAWKKWEDGMVATIEKAKTVDEVHKIVRESQSLPACKEASQERYERVMDAVLQREHVLNVPEREVSKHGLGPLDAG